MCCSRVPSVSTNQGLLALRATVYLSLLGPHGLREVAELSCQKAHYAAEQLTAAGLELAFAQPFFKEFVVRCRGNSTEIAQRARSVGFDIGPTLRRFPTLAAEVGASANEWLLVAVTESRTKLQIDSLANAIRK